LKFNNHGKTQFNKYDSVILRYCKKGKITIKYILKRAFGNEIPKKIVQRKKQGFGVPIYDWFLQNLGDFAQQKILDFTERTNYFDKIEIQFLLNERNANKIWYILNFVIWYECWIEKQSINIH
jgi:asparagine synthase (glutamine-hydrolysing)